MSSLAMGSFTVEMKPQGDPDAADGVSLGRLLLQKRFEGDLAGLSGVFRLQIVEGKHFYEFEYQR